MKMRKLYIIITHKTISEVKLVAHVVAVFTSVSERASLSSMIVQMVVF